MPEAPPPMNEPIRLNSTVTWTFPPRPTVAVGFWFGAGASAGAFAVAGIASVACKLAHFIGVL